MHKYAHAREDKNMIKDVTPEQLKAILAAVPEVEPEPNEVETLERADKSIADHGTVPHDSINWD